MLIGKLRRHLTVGNRLEAEDLARGDFEFWNVISVIDPADPAFPAHRGAKSLHTERFKDIDDPNDPTAVRDHHLESIFSFVDDLDETEPILVHCAQGLSRSPAVALGIIARSLFLDGEDDPVPEALDLLFQIRPAAAPNLLVAEVAFRVAFGLFLDGTEVKKKVENALAVIREDERVKGNHFHRW